MTKAALGDGTEEQRMRTKSWGNAFKERSKDKDGKVINRKTVVQVSQKQVALCWSRGTGKLNWVPVKDNTGLGDWEQKPGGYGLSSR